MIESELTSRPCDGVQLRFDVVDVDVKDVQLLVESTGFFGPHEVEVAVELVLERLSKGSASGYEFVIAEIPDLAHDNGTSIVGYVCYGQIPCTIGSYDIYWIVVSPQFQRRGLGRWLMAVAEEQILKNGGRQVFIDTSGRLEYASTREFYVSCGYDTVAELNDFYAPNDAKVVFARVFTR